MKRTMIPALVTLALASAALAADSPQGLGSTAGAAPTQQGGASSAPTTSANGHQKKKVKHHKKAAAPAQSGTMEKKPMEGTSKVQ